MRSCSDWRFETGGKVATLDRGMLSLLPPGMQEPPLEILS